MYRNQPITTYRRDLLNLLKKACVSWDRGGAMWFIGVEVEQKTSPPPNKKNPGSAPVIVCRNVILLTF